MLFPLFPWNIQHTPANLAVCFQKPNIFTLSKKKKRNTLHKLWKTSMVSVLAWALSHQPHWIPESFILGFEFIMKHLKVPTVQKWHAGNVNLQHVFGCLGVSLVASLCYLSLSPDFFLHPKMKHGQRQKQKPKKKTVWFCSRLEKMHRGDNKSTSHVGTEPCLAFSIAVFAPQLMIYLWINTLAF